MKAGYVPCADCCTCPAPTVLAATVSASKMKCGRAEFSGYASTPLKIYRGIIFSNIKATIYIDVEAGHSPCDDHYIPHQIILSGTVTLPADTCDTLDCAAKLINTVAGYTFAYDIFNELLFPSIGDFILVFCGDACADLGHDGHVSSLMRDGVPSSSTVADYTNDDATTGTATLTTEYTTYDLIALAIAALPSWPSFSEGSPFSSYSLATDELSFTVERSKYKFRFKVPKVGNGSCYKLTWVERTTLTPSATITDVPKTFTWNGTAAGYDATDPTTWPHTGEYEIDEPASNGETVIGYYTDPTDHTTFVQEYILAECRGCA